jgi:ABC-type nitrate/sulfonate/bicarbonate transport system permease component
LRGALPAIVLASGLLGAWELYVDLAGVQEQLLPAPHAVAQALWDSPGLLWRNFTVTAGEVLLGLALALSSGLALAVAIHLSPLLRRALYPLAIGSQAVPIPVIGVLLVFWWGFGIFPKLVVIALICFFPVVVSTVDGLAAVDPDQPKLLRTLDASRWQAFRFAELPAALPAAISGARIALTVGVIGAFIAETTTPTSGAYPGLGREILADINFQTARAYAGSAILIAFAIACFYALSGAERKLAPWHARARGETP